MDSNRDVWPLGCLLARSRTLVPTRFRFSNSLDSRRSLSLKVTNSQEALAGTTLTAYIAAGRVIPHPLFCGDASILPLVSTIRTILRGWVSNVRDRICAGLRSTSTLMSSGRRSRRILKSLSKAFRRIFEDEQSPANKGEHASRSTHARRQRLIVVTSASNSDGPARSSRRILRWMKVASQ